MRLTYVFCLIDVKDGSDLLSHAGPVWLQPGPDFRKPRTCLAALFFRAYCAKAAAQVTVFGEVPRSVAVPPYLTETVWEPPFRMLLGKLKVKP
jgi:hypothetical protein